MDGSKLLVGVALVAAVGCMAGGLAGCSSTGTGVTAGSSMTQDSSAESDDDSADPSVVPAELDWGPCTDEAATDPALECATLTVPLDYQLPEGATIDIALVRVPATGDRQGAILFNPGGPGGSGFEHIASGGPTITAALGLEDFDLIGFDPRGVDRSGGIDCVSDAELDDYAYLDDTPDSPEEQALLDAADESFSSACTAKYGDTLRLYSTANTARDMDAIRAALGDETISYLGISYGTYLGAVYATMFPDRVRAMALDSAFEPTGDTIEQQYTTQLVGFENAFDQWASWCEGETSCSFHSDDVADGWDRLLQQLDDNPITNDDGRIGNQTLMEAATIAALYSESAWPVLASALADAADGNPAGLFELADSYNGRDSDGTYNTIRQSNPVIRCASGIQAELPEDPTAFAAHLREIAPRFARTVEPEDFVDSCLDLMPRQPTDTIAYDGEGPIVVVGGTNDPATPFRWAEEMTAAMGPNAALVTFTGEGHGQLLASACVTRIEAELLSDGVLPADGTVCEADGIVARPEWWDSIPVPDGIDDVFDSPELATALGLGATQVYGEIRTSDLSPDDVVAAYSSELEAAGFEFVTDQEPLPGSAQSIYTAENGDIFTVLAVTAESFADEPESATIIELIPPATTLVLLLHIPQ